MQRNELIGKRIVQARNIRGLQAKDLANMLNISATRLSNWENATSGISAEYIFKISEILDVSSDYIIGLSDNPSEATNYEADSLSIHKVLAILRALNDIGQTRVYEYAEDLLESGRYDRK